MVVRSSAAFLALALVACGDPAGEMDAGASDGGGHDVGTTTDAGPGTDAGEGVDAGPSDAGGGLDSAADGGPPTGSGCGTPTEPGARTVRITHGGRERSYELNVPSGYDPDARTPVLFNLHGRMLTGDHQRGVSRMDELADAQGFLAVHPDGVGRTWNGGFCCGEAMSEDVDDVGFVAAILDHLSADLCVDETRVYATGLSNGGLMAHRLACDLADRITAIGAVAGGNFREPCDPARAIPVIHMHGTDDRIVAYGGPRGARDTTERWAARNGCGETSSVYFTNGDVTCEEWTGCTDDATVRLCSVDGGGHQWFGGGTIPFLGDNTTDIIASEAMWEFFRAHTL